MEQIELLKYVTATLERLEIPYALVGSWGSSIYGEPRFTNDIDIVIDMPTHSVSQFCTAFPARNTTSAMSRFETRLAGDFSSTFCTLPVETKLTLFSAVSIYGRPGN